MVNKVFLIGRLGRDPEMRYLSSGEAICNLSLATSIRWKNGDDWKEKTEWHKVVAFGRLAEICGEKLEKGSLVFVSGRLQTRSWEDKDGNKRYTTEVVVNEMRVLDYKPGDKAETEEVNDDVPF